MFQKLSLSALVLVSIFAFGCATRPAAEVGEGSALAALMDRRLALADRVAWAKYQSSLPIIDAERERQVLDASVAAATREGVDPELAARFFEAQILASRMRQEEVIRLWRRGGALPTWGPVDLTRDIRPQLDVLGRELIIALRDAERTGLDRDALRAQLRQSGWSWRVSAVATTF